uniref:Reverse transcriptase Ty1/copia-type domain-containing protein n=1 Tax=Peronospora matthiolae TaxID=2874970 RepID=A0AAV1TKQ0_9STRA
MDKAYWCEAMLTAVDIYNVVPHASSPKASPFEILFKRKPQIDSLRVFDSLRYVHVTKAKRTKIDDSGVRCLLLGYSKQHKVYRLLNASTGDVVISRSVTFAEHAIVKASRNITPDVIDVLNDEDYVQQPTDAAVDEPHVRPVRKKQAITYYEQEFPNLQRGLFNLDDFEAGYDAQYCLIAEDDGERASTYEKVLRIKYKKDWMRAVKSEIKSLAQPKTWALVEISSNKRSIGCKWVFRIKRDQFGVIVKFKARLVAKEFTQRPGVDYFDTFAPVARKESINVALALAAEENLKIENVDVDNDFLYGEVKEEIYMDQPDGFVDERHRGKKCLMHKALYGTKQAAREWNQRLNHHLEGQGVKKAAADPCVYVRRSKGNSVL